MSKPPSKKKMMDPGYTGEGVPNYKDYKAAFPNTGKASFVRSEEYPDYIMKGRGYKEYR